MESFSTYSTETTQNACISRRFVCNETLCISVSNVVLCFSHSFSELEFHEKLRVYLESDLFSWCSRFVAADIDDETVPLWVSLTCS